MSYEPTPADGKIHAYIAQHGPCTVKRLAALRGMGKPDYINVVLRRLTHTGYLQHGEPSYSRATKRPLLTWVATGLPLPPVCRFNGGADKAAVRVEALPERQITRATGTVPPELLACMGMVGLFRQMGRKV